MSLGPLFRELLAPEAGLVATGRHCVHTGVQACGVCVCARAPVLVASTASEPTGALSHPSKTGPGTRPFCEKEAFGDGSEGWILGNHLRPSAHLG